MAPVARRLSSDRGVLEPIQTTTSIDDQVAELKTLLENYGEIPVILVGFSWGAWLSYIVAAKWPGMIKKLILVGSGPFEEKYVAQLHDTRLQRLSKEARVEFESIIRSLGDPLVKDKDPLLSRLEALAEKTDTFDPVEEGSRKPELVQIRADVYQPVWKEAAELRRSGKLLELGKLLGCPVLAIHGDYDPHPAEGVEKPLSAVLKDFRFIQLKDCGHRPWVERRARDKFYDILEKELADTRLIN